MKKLFIMAALWFSMSKCTNAQALKVGDKVPNFIIGKIINYSKEILKFSDIKARLVIIDYWSTFCSPCVANMPQMGTLQKQFGDKILILPATEQVEEIIKPFWDKNKYLSSTSLPTIVGDTLKKYFPHAGVPYHVWILDGKVLAMPNSQHANAKEILDVLSGKKKQWVLGSGSIERRRNDKSPLVISNVKSIKPKYYSVITNADPLISGRSDNFSDENRSLTRVVFKNASIIYQYAIAYELAENIDVYQMSSSPNKRILEVKNLNEYLLDPKDTYSLEWSRDYNINYEAVLAGKISRAQMGRFMLDDLNKLLGLNGRIERRKAGCWIISIIPGVTEIKSDKVIPQNQNFVKNRDALIEKFGGASPELTEFWKKEEGKYPPAITSLKDLLDRRYFNFVDETGYTKPFNIYLRLKGNSFEDYKAALNRYGFELTKGIREIDMFVLTENDYQAKSK